MRISKKQIGIISLFLVIFLLGNAILSFALRPFSGSGTEMWEGFNAQEDLEVVFVGSSQCLCDIDPSVTEKYLGNSYNMGTNMQSIQNSFIAIKEAVNRKNVEKVVLLIDPETMEMERNSNFRAEQCFVRNLSDTLPIYERFRTTLSFVFSRDFFCKPYSVSYFFPWTYDRTSNVALNVKEKMQGQILDMEGHRDENGYLPSDEVYETDYVPTTFEEAKEWSSSHDNVHVLEPYAENMETLRDIAAFCQKKNVDLYVISVPALNTFSYYDYDGYVKFNENIKELLAEFGLDYYNLALFKDEYYETLNISDYRDIGHMNNAGSAKLSKCVGLLVMTVSADSDVSGWFKELYY